MGNDARGKLYDAVEERDIIKAEKILDRFPEIINEPGFKDAKLNPLIRAVWGGDMEMVKFLCRRGAEVNCMINSGHKPVYWAAIRNRFEILRYLIEEKNAIYEVADMKGFTVLDHAVINGNYEIAKYLYDKGLRFKSLDFYELEKDRFFQFEIDFTSVMEHIIAGKEECKLVFRKIEPETFKDPVVDPRESWGQWASRIADFKEPIIVEREDLPEHLRPENRGVMGKMSNYLNKQTLKCYTAKEIDEAEDWAPEEENNDEENKNSVIPPNMGNSVNVVTPIETTKTNKKIMNNKFRKIKILM